MFDVVIGNPCALFEEGSAAWWLMGCWLPMTAPEIAVGLGVVFAAVAMLAHRRPA